MISVSHRKPTTIFIEEGIEREFRLVARRRGRSMAAVVRDAIARELAAETRPPLSFIGVGDSSRRDCHVRGVRADEDRPRRRGR